MCWLSCSPGMASRQPSTRWILYHGNIRGPLLSAPSPVSATLCTRRGEDCASACSSKAAQDVSMTGPSAARMSSGDRY